MSGNSHGHHRNPNSSRSSRSAEEDHGRGLPPLRDVLREHFEEPRTPFTSSHSHDYPGHSGLRLPPIHISSSSRPEEHGRGGRTQNTSGYPQGSSTASSHRAQSSQLINGAPSFRVLAPSRVQGELVPVSMSYTKPPGIVREHVLTAGYSQDDDPRKRFECHLCGRRMERQSVYNQHMLTHTGERPYVCSYCPKTFNSKSNLNRHVLTHNSRGNDEYVTGSGEGTSSSKGYYTSSRRS